MSADLMIRRPCELVVRTDVADDFDPNGGGSESRVETRCYLEELSATEPELGGEAAESAWRVYLPADAPPELTTGDALAVDGELYEFTGDPHRVSDDRRGGGISHVEISAKFTGTEDSS